MLTLILLLSNEFVLKTKSSILIDDFLLYKIFPMKKIIFLSFLFFFLLNSKTLAVQCDPFKSPINLEYFLLGRCVGKAYSVGKELKQISCNL